MNRSSNSTTIINPLVLRAGPLTMLFEPELAFLRYIRLGNQEVFRGIYAAVRDQSWGTLPLKVTNIQLNRDQDFFNLTFDVSCQKDEINTFWYGKIYGESCGKVVYSLQGVARSDFLCNRIGLCVLHPIKECAGQTCIVKKVDGTQEEGFFPAQISPHHPFTNIHTITHRLTPSLSAEVCLEGGTFEMEDQRNWSDASFKTYCPPLSLPFPFNVSKDDTFNQTITLSLKGDWETKVFETCPVETEIMFKVSDTPGVPIPHLGLQIASNGYPLMPSEIERLKSLHLHHLRVNLYLSDPAYPSELARATREARELKIPLEVGLFLESSPDNELRLLLPELARIKPDVAVWFIFHLNEPTTSTEWIKLSRSYLEKFDAHARVGIGTNRYFAELNHSHPLVEAADMVCFPVNPQVHSFDRRSMVENLPTLCQMVQEARQFMCPLPVAVTPVTLKPPLLPRSRIISEGGELPSPVDLRQMSLFGAGWTLGSLKYLSKGGAESITYYETTGWLGIMETEQESGQFTKYGSVPGSVFPVFHVFRKIGEWLGGIVLPTLSSDPLVVEGLALQKDQQICILIANLTPVEHPVRIENTAHQMSIWHLDESNVRQAMVSPDVFHTSPEETIEVDDGVIHLKLKPDSLTFLDGANI